METRTVDKIITINVDVQNDFLPGGALAVPHGDEVIQPLNQLNTYTRSHGGTVIFTGDQHPEVTPHFAKDGGQWPTHCVRGTAGAALHKDLEVLGEDIIINKGIGLTDGYSGFEGTTEDGTPLEKFVAPPYRTRVALLIGGVATEYCVLNTTLDAFNVDQQHGDLTVYVIRDAMRAINGGDGEKAIEAMQQAGAIVIDSIDILTNKALKVATEGARNE